MSENPQIVVWQSHPCELNAQAGGGVDDPVMCNKQPTWSVLRRILASRSIADRYGAEVARR